MGGALIAAASPVLIEFLGLPGAGKSSLATRLVDHLRAQGYSIGERTGVGRMEKGRTGHYARFAAHAFTHGGHLPSALRLAASVRPFTTTRLRFATRLAVWPFHLALAQEREYNPLVLDQGPLQVTWCVLLEGTLREEKLLEDAISKLITTAGFSFVLVHVDVSPELAADRIEARGPMFQPFHRGKSHNVELLQRYRRQLEHVLEVAEASSGAPVLRVDGSRPLDENAAQIEAFVDRLLLGTQAGT